MDLESLYFAEGELAGPLRERLPAYKSFFATRFSSEAFVHDNVLLVGLEDLLQGIRTFRGDFLEGNCTAATVIKAAALAAHQALRPAGPKLQVRLVPDAGFPRTPFKDLKAASLGKYICVEGTVVKAGPVRPLVEQAVFECGRCAVEQQATTMRLADGVYRAPSRCTTTGCTGKLFVLKRGSPQTVYRNWQRIRMQEVRRIAARSAQSATAFDDDDEGRIPRCIDLDLFDDLVDSVSPGEIVLACGVVKVAEGEEGAATLSAAANGKTAVSYSLLLEANYLWRAKGLLGLSVDDGAVSREQLVRMAAADKGIFASLVASICPSIYGHSLVKAGLVLALLGGRQRRRLAAAGDQLGQLAMRGDVHLLMIGDPGLGKSQLLNAVTAVAPRGVYVCANATTAAGLTATMHSTGDGGEAGLEAGALVLADSGVCCIDEFDKIPDHRVLLDVMEQQQVNLAKAGLVCSLPARTAVIAAANPVCGHYNHRKTVAENIRMEPALLSRFDLLFVLLDRADAQLDRFLSDRVMRNLGPAFLPASGPASAALRLLERAPGHSHDHAGAVSSDALAPDGADDEVSRLAQKLRSDSARSLDLPFLRHYLAYARDNVHPKLSDEAAAKLKAYYLRMRAERDVSTTNGLPVTTRQLESLIRLTEARAKADLRALATASDADDAIALIKYSLYEVHSHGPTAPSLQDRNAARGRGKSGAMKRFVTELISISSRTGESVYSEAQLQQLYGTLQLSGMLPFGDLLEALNHNGYLLRKGHSSYKLIVT